MDEFLVSIQNLNPKIYYTILILLSIMFLRWITKKIVKKHIKGISEQYKWYKFIDYTSFFLGIIIILPMWTRGLKSLLTFFGLFSAGLAIALRDIVSNFFGWIYIITRKPFSIGDRIEIDGIKGDVIDIRILEFSIMEVGNWVDADQSTGRIIHVPNGKIIIHDLANYSQGFELIWNEIPVLITFESNWEKAKAILNNILTQKSISLDHKKRKDIIHSARKNYQKLTPIVYTSVEDSGIKLTMRYLCYPQNRRNSKEEIWEEILKLFADEMDIEFAYPTYRYYNPEFDRLLNREGTKEYE